MPAAELILVGIRSVRGAFSTGMGSAGDAGPCFEKFEAADIWWADNVLRQVDGIDVLRPGAHENLRAWYREHARPYYKNRRRNAAGTKQAKTKQDVTQDVIEAEQPERKQLH